MKFKNKTSSMNQKKKRNKISVTLILMLKNEQYLFIISHEILEVLHLTLELYSLFEAKFIDYQVLKNIPLSKFFLCILFA